MAIVHIAIFDAVNAIAGGHESYMNLLRARPSASMRAAVAQAARDTLVALFPSQKAGFDKQLAEDLDEVADGRAKADGIAVGRDAAAAILTLRASDGSQHAEPRVGVDYFPKSEPGKWRRDPLSQISLALGARWGGVTPFTLVSARQFRVPPPPASSKAPV